MKVTGDSTAGSSAGTRACLWEFHWEGCEAVTAVCRQRLLEASPHPQPTSGPGSRRAPDGMRVMVSSGGTQPLLT